MIVGSKAVWEARGGGKTILPDEQPVIDFAYATVVTIKPVRKGQPFDRDNIWVKRPGVGPIKAERYEKVLGRVATRDLPADVHVAPADIDGWRADA
jgi:sialic acid synthase SpsE